MANDLEFEDRKFSIFELLNTKKLPIVVRACEKESNDDSYDYCNSKISGKTEVLLQTKLKLKYGLIKVLRHYDNEAIQKKHGPEYVLEHDTYVGEEFYIPAKYPCSFLFVHRPGSWRRYASMSQVLKELPRFISVGEGTEASSSSGEKETIPARTKLELLRKVKDPKDGSMFLECSDGNRSFSFANNDRINCTEVDDTKNYHLFELVRNKMLPKVILFQNVDPKDCVLMDNELNSALLTSVEGPIELLKFEDIEILVGWVRDKEYKTYQTVVIPAGLWADLIVQVKSLHSEDEKSLYIENKYKHCGNTQFLETCLYWMFPDKGQVTWLRSPDFYKRSEGSVHMFEPITQDFQDSTDEEVCTDYDEIFEPPPPLPERKAISGGSFGHHKRANEKRSLFNKVHKELLGIAKQVHLKVAKNEGKPPKIHKRPHHSHGKEDEIKESSSAGFASDTSDKSISKISPKVSTSESNRISSNSSDSDIYQYGTCIESENEADYDYDYPDIAETLQHRPLPEVPEVQAPPTIKEKAEEKENDMNKPDKKLSSKNVLPEYVYLKMDQAKHLFQDNLTKDDFFQYTVIEVAHCFKHCGLANLAEVCLENRLDGSFFKIFDFQELKNQPFCLSSFQILKVKKMICDGWRPKVYT